MTLGSRRRVSLLVGFGAACAVLTGGLYLGAVRTARGQRLDEAALVGRSSNAAVQRATNELLDTLSVSSLAVAGIALAMLAVVRRRPRLALGVAVMVVGANISTQLLKLHLLDRPDLLHRAGAATVPSFPSGHATVAMSLGLALILVVPPRLRVLAGMVAAVYASTIGAATLTAGWHRPSDVLAAYLVAAAWTAVVVAFILIWRGGQTAPEPMFGAMLSNRRILVAGVVLILVAALVSGTVITVLRGRDLTASEVVPSYLGAVAAIAGSALVILGVMLMLLHGTLLDPPKTGPGNTVDQALPAPPVDNPLRPSPDQVDLHGHDAPAG